jgi:hypothetical protein
MALAPEDRKKLLKALEMRFKKREDLDLFIQDELDENPEKISSAVDKLPVSFSNLVEWADGEGRLGEMLEKLRGYKSGEDVLKVLSGITTAPSGADDDAELLYVDGQPFVNRDDLHRKLIDLAQPKGKRILIVRGERYYGNSHARERIFRLAERRDFHYVDIRLQQYGTAEIRPYDLGVAIAGAMKLEFSREVSDPKDSRWSVNFLNWLQGNLDRKQRWWIIIDDFEPDKVGVPRAVFEFIELLAARMDGTLSPLRLVLITWDRELPSAIMPFVEREDVQPVTDHDLAEYFIRFYRDFLEPASPATVANDVLARVQSVRERMAGDAKVLERMRDAVIDECKKLKTAGRS